MLLCLSPNPLKTLRCTMYSLPCTYFWVRPPLGDLCLLSTEVVITFLLHETRSAWPGSRMHRGLRNPQENNPQRYLHTLQVLGWYGKVRDIWWVRGNRWLLFLIWKLVRNLFLYQVCVRGEGYWHGFPFFRVYYVLYSRENIGVNRFQPM